MSMLPLIDVLEASGATLTRLFSEISTEEARYKPEPDRWSLLEILCHLCDEERDDFRKRLALTLDDPATPWPPIDPEGWARERDYNARDLSLMVADFRQERSSSLAWLRGLDQPEWGSRHEHPALGPMTAGDLLASWAAHDLLHLRQATNTRLAWLLEAAKPHSTRYAMP